MGITDGVSVGLVSRGSVGRLPRSQTGRVFLYCTLQVHRDILITLYHSVLPSTWDCAVGVVTNVRVGPFGVRFLARSKYLHLLITSISLLASVQLNKQPLMQWVQQTVYLGIKQRQRNTKRSPASSAKVKTKLRYISTPPYASIACKDNSLSFYNRSVLP
jgi:hypothetical protein